MNLPRVIPRAALIALAKLREPLDPKHLQARLDGELGNLCTALREKLPEWQRTFPRQLPRQQEAEYLLDAIKYARHSSLANTPRLVERIQGQLLSWQQGLEQTGYTSREARELYLKHANLREDDPEVWQIVLAWEWVDSVAVRVAELEAVTRRLAENAGNLPRADGTGGSLPPANTESREKLYHASLYADDLLARGFSVDKPKGRTGIGSLGSGQAMVSFTHSRVYATKLYRFLAMAWQVANGELDYARATALMGKGQGFAELRPEKAQRHVSDPTFFNADKARKRQRTDHAQREFKRFCADYAGKIEYLAVCNLDQLYRQLLTVPLKSLGVVECLVDVQDAEYLAGEFEFRVAPSRVLKVLRRVTG
jgi:hypothetical protein